MNARRWGLVVGVLLTACAGGGQSSAPLTPDPDLPPTDEQIAALQNAQTTVADNGDAGEAAAVATEDPAKAQENELKGSCEASRASRAQEARDYAQAWLMVADHLNKNAAGIKHACVIKSLKGARVVADHDAHGKIVRIKPAGATDYVVCKGALPAGVTQNDARLFWYVHDADFEQRVALADSTRFGENQKCADLDKAAGLDTQVTYGDAAGLATLAKYAPRKP